MTSVMRPDPRYELALASQVPHIQTEHPDTSAVAVTLHDSGRARVDGVGSVDRSLCLDTKTIAH